MLKEIGSDFWIEYDRIRSADLKPVEDLLNELGIKGNDYALLSTGRSAISFVLNKIMSENQGKTSWNAVLPPFTCHTVIRPFLQLGFNVCTYEIDNRLNASQEMLDKAIAEHNADVVFLHRYFGFDTLKLSAKKIEEYRKQGIIFIEDRTQNLFSSFPSLPVDYIVGSIRKWDAIPDGGYAVCLNGIFDKKPSKEDRDLVAEKLRAFSLKHKYMLQGKGEKKEFLSAFERADSILNKETEFYQMSAESERIFNSLDINELKQKRRSNYQVIFDGIKNRPDIQMLTAELDEDAVPLYLALKSENRGKLQDILRLNDIFAPIIWPKSGFDIPICEEAKDIYDKVLCIPIDQRYNSDDMDRIVEIIKRGLSDGYNKD